MKQRGLVRRWWDGRSGVDKCMTLSATPPAVVGVVGAGLGWPYAVPAMLSVWVFVPLGVFGWFVYRIRKGEGSWAEIGSFLGVLLFMAVSFGLLIAYLVYLTHSGFFQAPE